jgi:four helix bundle protein
MGTHTKNFEDLIAWQKARTMVREVYRVTKLPAIQSDARLSSQLRAAAVSVKGNIAEGYERGSPGEFHRFLGIAKASCAEVRSHVYAAADVGYLDEREAERLIAIAFEVGRIVGALRVAVAKRR